MGCVRIEQKDLFEQFINFSIEPLCKFLGKPIPDQPFPRVNNTKAFNVRMRLINGVGAKKTKQKKKKKALIINLTTPLGWALTAVVVAVIAFGVRFALKRYNYI